MRTKGKEHQDDIISSGCAYICSNITRAGKTLAIQQYMRAFSFRPSRRNRAVRAQVLIRFCSL